jgi:ribosomal protein S18 acetylase RimI-like enzyme
VGTLDLNQGSKLPAEELVGRLPEQGAKQRLRGYISNVATWQGARRKGVARSLLQQAEEEAAALGVRHLYGEGLVCAHVC